MTEKDKGINTISDGDLWCLLVRTWFAISRLRELELAQFGLTLEQSSVLTLIQRCGGSTTAKNLEYLTLRQQHSISTLIKRMLRGGLVGKERRPNERRNRIFISEEGENLLGQLTTTSIEMVFSSLTEDEKLQFAKLICSLFERARDLLGVSYKLPFLKGTCDSPEGVAGQTRCGSSMTSDYELWTTLDAAGFAISRLRELELAQFGLTLEQSLILIIIEHCGGSTTTKEIEYLTLRQHHSISTLINRMCRVGLVYKEKSPAEKRYRIFMSKEGESLLSKVTEDSIEIVFSNLSVNEKLQFTGYLRSLHRQARNLLGVPHKQPATTAH
jgi:DNA-binding MarR family transcriptional regulator